MAGNWMQACLREEFLLLEPARNIYSMQKLPLCGVLPVNRTIKNNNFCIVSRITAGDIFRLRLYIDYDIPLVSLHLTSFVIVGYCSN